MFAKKLAYIVFVLVYLRKLRIRRVCDQFSRRMKIESIPVGCKQPIEADLRKLIHQHEYG